MIVLLNINYPFNQLIGQFLFKKDKITAEDLQKTNLPPFSVNFIKLNLSPCIFQKRYLAKSAWGLGET